MLKIIILPITLLLSTFILADKSVQLFDDHFHDFGENAQEVTEQKKSAIFVFFYLEDCPFCHKMRQTVLNQPQIIDFYKQYFLNYELDANGALEMTDFNGNSTTQRDFASKQHNVFVTPVLAFFNPNGKLIAYRTGFLTKEDFLLLGHFVKDKQYLSTSFIRYKRQQQ